MSSLLSRRRFLAGASSAALACAQTQRPQRIIVLGAGLAGLCTAFELQNLGHSVTVLEAQLRPGGRVHTLREPFAPGLYSEAGAARIPLNHEITQHYVKRMGLPMKPVAIPGTRNFHHVRNQRVIADDKAVWPVPLTPAESALGYSGIRRKFVEETVQRLLGEHPFLALKPFDKIPLGAWLRKQGASAAATELLTMGFGENFGSAAWLLLYSLNLHGATMSFHIEGGNDRLPHELAKRVQDLRYGQPVMAVTQSDTGVRVMTRRGESLTADRVVCTLPSPVIGRILDGARISASKAHSIHSQAYSHTAKVFLQTRTRFWLKDGWSGNVSTDLPIERLTPDVGSDPNGRGILTVYPIADYANALEGMTTEDRHQSALASARKIFPELDRQFEGAVSKCWGTDPWQRGAFTVQKPGQLHYLEEMSKPEGRIHFAGEHTSRWTGWMQGALESAQRVVRELS